MHCIWLQMFLTLMCSWLTISIGYGLSTASTCDVITKTRWKRNCPFAQTWFRHFWFSHSDESFDTLWVVTISRFVYVLTKIDRKRRKTVETDHVCNLKLGSHMFLVSKVQQLPFGHQVRAFCPPFNPFLLNKSVISLVLLSYFIPKQKVWKCKWDRCS